MSSKKTFKQQITLLWCYQLGLLLLMTFATWMLFPSPYFALSVLVGGLIYWVPNAYFTLYAFRYRGAQAAALMLRSMYRGEFGKLLLTAVGFALAFVLLTTIVPFALFGSFIAMTLSQWYWVSRW